MSNVRVFSAYKVGDADLLQSSVAAFARPLTGLLTPPPQRGQPEPKDVRLSDA